MLPDPESLRCFAAAAHQLNFRAAATSVALSPAAFGTRIQKLEEQLGAPLFTRSTRRVALTAAGEKLLPQARRVLEEAQRCLGVLSGDRVPYELTVGTRFELGLSWLVPALSGLSRAHPERTIHVTFGDSAELLAALRRGSMDCAISSARIAGGDFRYEMLHPEHYRFVAAPRLLKRLPMRQPVDATRHILLDIQPDLPLFRYLRDVGAAEESWPFSRLEFLGTIGAVRYRVLEGRGLAVLPSYFIRNDLATRRLRALLPGMPLQSDSFRLIWRTGHARELELRALAAELRKLPLR